MLEVSLLGEQQVTDADGAPRLRSSRTLALIAFLVVHAGSPQPRQRIAGVFWPDSTEEQALTNLRRELHHLRAVLDGDPSLVVTPKDLCWADAPTCTVDVRRFLAEYSNVYFHTGIFPNTTRGLEDRRYAFVHLDLDLPRPTRAALDYFHPRLVPGGILLAHDYCDADLRTCIDDWFERKADTLVELPWSQLMVIRQGATG